MSNIKLPEKLIETVLRKAQMQQKIGTEIQEIIFAFGMGKEIDFQKMTFNMDTLSFEEKETSEMEVKK